MLPALSDISKIILFEFTQPGIIISANHHKMATTSSTNTASSPVPTFGVEFEMTIAVLGRNTTAPDDAVDEKRKLRFSDWGSLAEDIVRTLNDSGYKATCGSKDFGSWDVTSDVSIAGPPEETGCKEYEKYVFHPLEIRSPALYFTPESLQEVEAVCSLLKSTYCINTNKSTGLHVHIGYGEAGYEFNHLRNLIAFLWAFELQIDSIHPPHRFGNPYCSSMREGAELSASWANKKHRLITPIQGVNYILNIKRKDKLFQRICFGRDAYNFGGIRNFVKNGDNENIKPTVEFRQHESTLNSDEVINWVKTVAGIVEFTRTIDNNSLRNLLEIVKWRIGRSLVMVRTTKERDRKVRSLQRKDSQSLTC
jgi:hypothetical protein